MGFVFVSHASIDKLRHVRPIVLALAREHVGIWVDKPGQGDRHLGLDQAVIERLGIRGLMNGPDWNLQISEALQECDAVLVCLSKQLLNDSAVLNQEVAIGWHSRKLVACRVDDLDLEDIPDSLGLPDFRRMQSLRVDTVALQRCIDWLDMNPGKMPGQLPSDMQVSWEAIRKLHLDLETVRGDRVEKGIVAPAVRVPELDLVEYGISQAAGCSPPAMVGCLLRSHELGTVDLKAVHLTTKAIWDLPMHQWTNTFETLVPQKPPRAHIPARVGETVTAALDVVITQDARVSFRVAVYSRHAKNEKLEDWHFDTPVGSMLFLLDLKLETSCGTMTLPSVVADLCGYYGTGTAQPLKLSKRAEGAIERRITEVRAALASGATIDPDLLAGLRQYESSFRPRRD